MRLLKAIALRVRARLHLWRVLWEVNATPLDNVAVAALAFAAVALVFD